LTCCIEVQETRGGSEERMSDMSLEREMNADYYTFKATSVLRMQLGFQVRVGGGKLMMKIKTYSCLPSQAVLLFIFTCRVVRSPRIWDLFMEGMQGGNG